MRRRDFLSAVAGAASVLPTIARAQERERPRRIGAMMSVSSDDPVGRARDAAFLQGLQKLGWTVGRNVQIEYRWGGTGEIARKHAAELVAFAPDVILAAGTDRIAPPEDGAHIGMTWKACWPGGYQR